VLAEAANNNIKVIFPFVNFWPDLGGMQWYVDQARPSQALAVKPLDTASSRACCARLQCSCLQRAPVRRFAQTTQRMLGACPDLSVVDLACETAHLQADRHPCARLQTHQGPPRQHLEQSFAS